MSIFFEIRRTGRDFSCSADGASPFFVGRRVPFDGNIGLYNIFAGTKLARLNYDAADFSAEYGFWARFIEPTAKCEGVNFLTLNTYDRAAFTFGFGQFAAHVPNGDFVQYFRALLALPQARDYFPTLSLNGGRIVREDPPGTVQALESDDSTQPLMNYLNPGLGEVEDSEVIAAAKLIHWTTNHADARSAQVKQMVATFRSFMAQADARLGIDGRPATECAVIADVLHHGRGGKMKWTLFKEALASAKPFDALIAIGAPTWDERKKTLRRAIGQSPEHAQRHWRSASGDFV